MPVYDIPSVNIWGQRKCIPILTGCQEMKVPVSIPAAIQAENPFKPITDLNFAYPSAIVSETMHLLNWAIILFGSTCTCYQIQHPYPPQISGNSVTLSSNHKKENRSLLDGIRMPKIINGNSQWNGIISG